MYIYYKATKAWRNSDSLMCGYTESEKRKHLKSTGEQRQKLLMIGGHLSLQYQEVVGSDMRVAP